MPRELCCEKGKKGNNKKISLRICTKKGSEMAALKDSPESLSTAVWGTLYNVDGSSLQWCKGKMMPFSVVSVIHVPVV